MKLENKLKKWTDQQIITPSQAKQIADIEKKEYDKLKTMILVGLSCFFIGFGVLLMIGANWDKLSGFTKLGLDFLLGAVLLEGARQSILKSKKILTETLLFLSFFWVGGSIGLIGQVFQLSGGFQSFALFWALCALPVVLHSKIFLTNMMLVFVAVGALPESVLDRIFDYVFRPFYGFMLLTFIFALLTEGLSYLNGVLKTKVVFLKALESLLRAVMYIVLFVGGIWHMNEQFSWQTNGFVLAFLGAYMVIDYVLERHKAFGNKALMAEIYIFLIFISQMDHMLLTGFGFVMCGVLILGLLYVLKRTNLYIQKMGGRR